MDAGLEPRTGERTQPVGIRVASQQTGLEEKQAGGPNRGAATEPGQDVTSHYRLQLKKQKSAQEYRDGKENMIRWEEKWTKVNWRRCWRHRWLGKLFLSQGRLLPPGIQRGCVWLTLWSS